MSLHPYRTEYRTCRGKVPFATEGEAREQSRWLSKYGRGQRPKVYRCPFCGAWHIGTKRKVKGNQQYAS